MANSVVDVCKSPSKINQEISLTFKLSELTFLFLNQLKQDHLGQFSSDVCTALCCWCL